MLESKLIDYQRQSTRLFAFHTNAWPPESIIVDEHNYLLKYFTVSTIALEYTTLTRLQKLLLRNAQINIKKLG